jgi:S1-C subfamily serine protease
LKNPHLSVGRLLYLQHLDTINSSILVGCGTGFAVGPHEIMTANHVCEAADKDNMSIYLSFFDGNEMRIIGRELIPIKRDPQRDLCILFLFDNPLKPIKFAKNKPSIGDISYTYGVPKNGPFTLTSGFYGYDVNVVYSSKSGEKYSTLVTSLSLPVFKGNSGGPILNDQGEFVGISIMVDTLYSHISYTPTYQDVRYFLGERYRR